MQLSETLARPLTRKLGWIALLYLASGTPYGVVHKVWPVYFASEGVSLADIGLMSLLALPWTWKMLWAPLVDRFGSRQLWIAAGLAGMAAASLGLLAFPGGAAAAPALLLWPLLLAFTTAAATQDVAIDAYAVDVSAPRETGAVNATRVAAYRVAVLTAGGGLVVLAGAAGWSWTWLALAAVFLLLIPASLASPRVPLDRQERRHALGGVLTWALSWRMLPVVAFALTFKVGDGALGRMVEPFWVDRGMSLAEIGLVSTTLGMLLSIAGAVAGGWWIARRGIFTALVGGGLAQALSNLGYLAVAGWNLPREALYGAAVVESFCQGLGTAAFLSFLMNLCDREHAATQFALLSALYGLSRDLAGAVSGFGVERLGYAAYFGWTCVLAVPGLALLPAIRGRIREEAEERGRVPSSGNS